MLNLYEDFWHKLRNSHLDESNISRLVELTEGRLHNPKQGDFARWLSAYLKLPEINHLEISANLDAITCEAALSESEYKTLKEGYEGLIPWRKGPFNMFSLLIDAEWQSHMKWNRIEKNLPDLNNKLILDVGCGNGYYMFRMAEHSPRLIMGIDPGILQVMQFWSIEKYRQSGACVLPISMEKMPTDMKYFDVVFSMGVLYHRKSPIHHIKELYESIRPKGFLVIETLIVNGDERTCLIPNGRYAQMRNVWFLPSVGCLSIMLERNGFENIHCVDITTTDTTEQRSTSWMNFHSLKDFLNEGQTRTIEGHDLPTRATLIAQKK